MATSGLSYDNRSSPSGFALGIRTVINNNSSVLWINYYIYIRTDPITLPCSLARAGNKRTTDFIVTETNVSYSPVRAGDNYDYIAEDLIQTEDNQAYHVSNVLNNIYDECDITPANHDPLLVTEFSVTDGDRGNVGESEMSENETNVDYSYVV